MRRTLSVLTLVTCFPLVAAAQDPAAPMPAATPAVEGSATPPASDPLAKENWPLSAADRPAGLSAGMLQVDLWSWTSLSKDAVAKPIAFPLAAYYGVTNELQLGLVPATGTGLGLCVTGEEKGCSKVFNDIALQGIYSITGRGSAFELAAFGQLNFAQLSDPMLMNLQVGAVLVPVVAGGMVGLLAYPSVGFALNHRSATATDPIEQKDYLFVPVTAFVRASPNLSPMLFTGIAGPFDGFGDSYGVPVGVGALYAINAKYDIGARFDFTNLLGKVGDAGRADGRALNVWFSIRPL